MYGADDLPTLDSTRTFFLTRKVWLNLGTSIFIKGKLCDEGDLTALSVDWVSHHCMRGQIDCFLSEDGISLD